MQSAIFEGKVRHRRMLPVPHAFSYRMFLMYVDLGELDRLFAGRWLWSASRPALARFRREDHFGGADEPLDECIRNLVATEAGFRPEGPVRLLTHLRYFGYCFNPVSFYYCYRDGVERLEAIVAEVNNTPWGERQMYVMDMRAADGTNPVFSPEKAMHVSPFMPMDIDYAWRFSQPDERLFVHMENHREGKKIFDASLSLERTAITGRSLARVLASHPLITLKVIFAIHWQALRLWLKRVPVHNHPSKDNKLAETKP